VKVSLRLFGIQLPSYRPVAEAADAAGSHTLGLPDHVVAVTGAGAAYPYSSTGRPSFGGATPFGDPLVMAGHVAAATTRIALGVGVYVLPLRHPLAAARAVLTAQELSRGRLVLGVGVGWMREEFAALDALFDGRGDRTDEMLRIMRRLWSGQPVAHDEHWYRFPEVQMSPPMSRRLPVLVGGTSPRALTRAARLADGWYGPPAALDEVVQVRTRLEEELRAEGRAPETFRLVVRVEDPVTTGQVEVLRDAGLRDVVANVPRDLAVEGDLVAWVWDFAARLRDRGFDLGDPSP
jgi:probable F420-dependent oxidoreductase